MKIGYARVSTGVQNLDLQLTALDEAGCKRIFQDKISGADRNRPELKRLLDQLRASDTVVVWKLDRLARSTCDLLEVMETVRKSDASFQSLTEGRQELAARLLQEGKSVSEVATIFKVHGATIYRMPSGELQP